MKPIIPEAIADYCAKHSSPPSKLADEIEQYTIKRVPYAQMLTGPWEGRLLRMLVGLVNAKRVLEVGTFTGYSALAMAEALPDDGELITCDTNPETSGIARAFFDRSPHGKKVFIHLGPALETFPTLRPWFDLAFIDADKTNYYAYFDACLPLVRTGGLIVADNVLWSGEALNPQDDDGRAIAAFNNKVCNDARVECVMLPIRDGVSLIRKK